METLNKSLLSKRENQVLTHIAKGESQRDIAEKLYICVRTVKFHCGNIYQKLAVKNKIELMQKFDLRAYHQ